MGNFQWRTEYTKYLSKSSDTLIKYYSSKSIKGLVHFEIDFWYVLAYLKGIQDVSVFVSTVFSFFTFFSQTVVVYQSYTGG